MKVFGFFISISAIFFSGCAALSNDPYNIDQFKSIKTIDFSNDEKAMRLSYVARHLMEGDDRQRLVAEMLNSELVRGWSVVSASLGAQMATDVAVGQVSSAAGGYVGAAVMVGEFVYDEIFDGSVNQAGQAFLPAVMNNKELLTASEAHEALRTHTNNQVKKIADVLGWEHVCLKRCSSSNQVHMLKKAKELPNEYIYRPDEIIIQIRMLALEEVHPDDPISAALGFPVKWKTKDPLSYVVDMYSEPRLDESGNPRIERDPNRRFSVAVADKVLSEVRLGRDLMRIFHDSPYTYFGKTLGSVPNLFVINGNVHTFYSNSSTRIVDSFADEENLLLKYKN